MARVILVLLVLAGLTANSSAGRKPASSHLTIEDYAIWPVRPLDRHRPSHSSSEGTSEQTLPSRTVFRFNDDTRDVILRPVTGKVNGVQLSLDF